MQSKFGVGYVPGRGPINPRIAIVGQSVGKHELDSGLPFSGPEVSEIFDSSLRQAGLRREEVYITNVLKYLPNFELKLNNWPDTESVEKLWEELETINPQKIIALGAVPLYFLTGKLGIQDWRGSVLKSSRLNKLVIPTFNPAHLVYQKGGEIQSYWQKVLIDLDVKRAVSIPLDWKPPYRNLHIAKSSLDVVNFMDRNAAESTCAVDIETIKTIPACIAFSFKKYEAISIPLFQKLDGIQICSIPQKDIVEIWRLIQKIFDTKQVDGQNFKFDQERLERELNFKIRNFRSDTMLKAYVINPELPKSQAFLASVLTEEPYYKDEGKEFNPKRDKIDQLLLYNAKDAAVCKEISEKQDETLKQEKLHDYYYGYYHHLHSIYYNLESHGLPVNEEKRKELIAKYKGHLETIETELEKILGWKANVNSPKDTALAVYETLKLPKRESLDEDSLVALAANTAKKPEQRKALQLIIDGRRVRKLLGPDRLNFQVDWDGKAKTLYRICGTETGRRSTSLLRSPVRIGKVGLSFHAMSKHGDIGSDFRQMFVAPPGFVFVNQDLSQAEARIVALLSNDLDTLELFDTVDIHKFTAAIYLDLPIVKEANTARKAIELKDKVNDTLKIIQPDERFVAKFVRHGGNYGMKKYRLMEEINTSARRFHIPILISEFKAGKLLTAFHAFTPKIREVFHKEVIEAINDNRELQGPFGDRRYFFDRLSDSLYKEAFAHIPQNTVANQIGRALINSTKEMPDIYFVVEAHDAICFMCKEDEALDRAKVVRKYLETPIDFSDCTLKRNSIIIPSDLEIGQNYGELEKKKWAS